MKQNYFYSFLLGLMSCLGFSQTSFVSTPTPATHLNFDGANDFVSVPNSSSLSFGVSNVTLEAMVKMNNPQINYSGIISKATAGPYLGIQLVVVNNKIALEFGNGTMLGVANGLIGTTDLNDNNWHHVASVVDRATNNIKLYVDGIVEANFTNSLVGTTDITTTTPMFFGKDRNSGTFLQSNIDEVRVWNIARTAEQIKGSKNCELQGTETGLVAYYKFNQGIDQADNSAFTTLNDATANGNNGTLSNFALTGLASNWPAGSVVTTGSVMPSAAIVAAPVVYNRGDIAVPLTATTGGTGLLWYTTATGGSGTSTAPTPNTSASGSTSYWVASTNANGCESERVELVVSVNAPATHLNFDGIDDFVSLGNTMCTTLAGKSHMTVEAWIRVANTTGAKTIITNHSSDTQFNLRIVDNFVEGFLGFGAYNVTSPAGSITAGTWYHVAMVYNDTTLKLFINGGEVGSTTIPAAYAIQASTQPYVIGKSAFNERFAGDIDEIRVWGVALNQNDIHYTMSCELQSAQTGVVAYYKFNHGFDNAANSSETTLNDAVGSSNGTLTNFALAGTASNWKSGSPMTTGNTCTTLSTKDFNNLEGGIVIYPNPSTGVFTVDSKEAMSIQIYDLVGKIVLKQEIGIGSNSIDISDYSDGVYFIKAQNASSTATYKIIKR